MGYFSLSKICALVLAGYVGSEVVAKPQNGFHSGKVLRAATRRNDLYRRDIRIRKKFESEVVYVDAENSWSGNSVFASQVKVSSNKPILNLEEIEHHLQDVQCTDGKMKLSFVSDVSAMDARYSCHSAEGGLIITSHESCNRDGERAAYMVDGFAFTDEEGALELKVRESLWKNAFDHFDISFGHTTEDHVYRRHADFSKVRGKRQAEASVTDSLVPAPTDLIPGDTPDNVNSVTFDLSSETRDNVFPLNDFAAIAGVPPVPIEMGCNLCTTTGELVVSQGEIVIDATQIDVVPDILEGEDDGRDPANFITGGFIDISATNMGASIDLFARPPQSDTFMVTLFALPVLGFAIPNIGNAGAVFEANILAGFTIEEGGLEVNFGAAVDVPDNANIRLELTDIAGSGVAGFQDSTLTPLPFNVNVTDIEELLVSVAFKPSVPVGFKFQDSLQATVSVTMDLPRFDAKLSTNAEENCDNASPGNSTEDSNSTSVSNSEPGAVPDISGLTDAVTDLVLVEANLSVSLDVNFGLTFPLLPAPFNAINEAANIFSTEFPLVTNCVGAGLDNGEAAGTGTAVYPPATDAPYTNMSVAVPAPTEHPAETVVVPVPQETPCDTESPSEAPVPTWHPVASPEEPEYPVPTHPVASEMPAPSEHIATTLEIPIPSETPAVTSEVPLPPPGTVVSPPEEAPTLPTTEVPPFPVPTGSNVTTPTGGSNSTPGEFTGAATPGTQIPASNWRSAAWQVTLLGTCFLVGAGTVFV